ncbi:MAG: Holliday junction resolvase RuvX, partial [Sulfurifustaceae bacterium]
KAHGRAFSMKMEVFLGFDYGTRHTGVAVGSRHTGLAQPLTQLAARGGAPDWEGIQRLVDEWRPQALVVGLPLNMDGTPNPMTHAARAFGEALHARYNLPVYMVDERLSTRAATDQLLDAGVPLKRHKHQIDKRAAQTILQAFLDERR